MLILEKIKFKNFISYGSSFTEVDLNSKKLNIIKGINAQGKTTIIVAISFALYGKTFNNVPKQKLVNSINQKDCVVELEFINNNNHYKIIRGIKPNIFEIYQNDVLINVDANSRDYQKVLEEQIIQMDFKTFIQTVIVSMSNFTPFMELSQNDRRVVVEDLLGVGILTTMNKILRERIQENNQLLSENNIRVTNLKNQLTSAKAVIENFKKINSENVKALQNEKERLLKEVDQRFKEVEKLQEKLEKMNLVCSKYDAFMKKFTQIQDSQKEVVRSLKSFNNEINTLKTNNTCPLCKQEIHEDYKQHVFDEYGEKIAKLEEKLAKLNEQLEKYQTKNKTFLQAINNANSYNVMIGSENGHIQALNRQIKSVDDKINQPKDNNHIIELENDFRLQVDRGRELLEVKDRLVNNKSLFEQGQILLRDDGIKTSIINQYLPIINQTVNKYLQEMDFYLYFELDSQFKETLKARGRDNMTYTNLSQGEKRRLDMAIMFTWRYIAQLRNSCNCANLFIDEILDSSLDADGIESVLSLLRSLENTYIFLISHRANVQEIEFDRVITVSKPNQFSQLDFE